ncbi:MAG: PIG-L family deacetylase [Deltaproteobacteria bacterium]|nr:PIG-L family deacetylase [Deltaproteobacteria bacterium]
MKRKMLFLLAHPDDETFGPGGTIAKYSAEGVAVYLAVATKGQAGMAGDPPLTDREHLGEVRAAELMCAAGVLGIRKVAFLGFEDGRLVQTPLDCLVEKCVEQIRRVRPHVVVGFGPEGVSRHPDHMAMSRAAAEAFDAAADPSRFPGQLVNGVTAWASAKLYRIEVEREILEHWNVPFAGVPRKEITTVVDTSSYVDTKIEAFGCHRTQSKDSARILAREGYREFARRETFVLAKSRLPRVNLPEIDMFDGIPDEPR